MRYVVEFVGWAEVTGDSSEGAIVRLSQADEHVLSAVVRVTRTLMATEHITTDELRQGLPKLATTLVGQYAETDQAWVERHRGETETPWVISDPGVLKWEQGER